MSRLSSSLLPQVLSTSHELVPKGQARVISVPWWTVDLSDHYGETAIEVHMNVLHRSIFDALYGTACPNCLVQVTSDMN